MLDVVDATTTYHGTLAVRWITSSAWPGDVVGMLGPNRSGKAGLAAFVTSNPSP